MFLHQSHHHHDNTLYSAGLVFKKKIFAHLYKKHFDIIDIFSCLAMHQVILNAQCN